MEQKTLGLTVFLLALLTLPFSQAQAMTDFWEAARNGKDHMEAARTLAAQMSNVELLGQVLMFGYLGEKPSPELLGWIESRAIGGVKVFGWNSGNLPSMVEGIGRMQAAAARTRFSVPLLVATDQEGGWVRHVRGTTSVTPGNLAIGAGGVAADAYDSGLIIGRELAALGINMNFAPTVDVYTNRDAHVIGPRAFSSDPITTAFLGTAFFRGLEDAGIIATAKHFPGHGNSNVDSHGALPILNETLEEIWDRELLPYRVLIREGMPSIMTGHLSFPRITGDVVPATLSEHFQRVILRDMLGFRGVIITDDMRMHGVLHDGLDIPTASREAIIAGSDIVMLSLTAQTQQEVWELLMHTMETDAGFRATVRRSAERILALKMRYLKTKGPEQLSPDPAAVGAQLSQEGTNKVLFNIAFRSTTVLRDGLIPLEDYASKSVALIGQHDDYLNVGLQRFRNATTYKFSYHQVRSDEISDIEAIARSHDIVIFCLTNHASLNVLRRLEPYSANLIVLSVLTPVYLYETPWVRSALAVYATGINSFEAGFAAILGDFVPEGIAPITVFSDGE